MTARSIDKWHGSAKSDLVAHNPFAGFLKMLRSLLILLSLAAMSNPLNAQVWATAVSKNESKGTAIVYRYVKEFEKGFVRAKQPARIIVTWRYTGEKGMPSVGERQRMDDLEDAITPLQEDGFSTLALVSTGDNLKEWTYYARTEKGFLARLNLALRSKPAFPIEIHTSSDPTWRTYVEFASGVKQ